MATIIAGIDECLGSSTDNRILSEFCQRLEQAGHTAINVGRGPSAAQNGAGAHSGDYMVQLAAGNCLCTLTDFYVGVKNGYYHVKKAGIVYWHHAKDPATWASKRAWDDNFCKGEPLTLANQYRGRPVKEFYDDHSDKLLYVPKIDSNCTSGTTMAEAYLAAMNGGSVSADSTGENSSNTGGGGSTALDYIKQVLSDNDKYGVFMYLNGKELDVHASGINSRVVDEDELKIKKPLLLSQDNIVLDSVEITEYDPITPNYVKSGKTVIEDKRLIERYGRKVGKPTAPFSELKNGKQYKTVKFKRGKRSDLNISDKEWYINQLMLLKRGHGHTISFKHKLGNEEDLVEYKQIRSAELDLPLFGIHDYYHITKISLDKNDLEAETVSLTLEPAPPSVYVEPTTVNTNKTSTGNPVNVSGNDCNPNDSLETHHWSMHRTHPPKCTRAGLTVRGNSNRQYAKDTAQHNSSSRELVEWVKSQCVYDSPGYPDNPKGAARCPENMWNGSRPMRGNCADFARLLKCILDVNGYTSCICHVPDGPGHYYNAIWENGGWTVCDLCNSNAYGHANHGDQKPVGTPDNPAG